jgi:hypothetical protein
LIQIEAKSDEKPQFTIINEHVEEDFNKELSQKMSFAKFSTYCTAK